MKSDELYEAWVNAEREAKPSPGNADHGWKRLQTAIRHGTRPMPIVAAPLSLGTLLFSTKAAALLAVAGTSTAVAAATWAYRVELGITPRPPAPEATTSLAVHDQPARQHDLREGAANDVTEAPVTPPASEQPPAPPTPSAASHREPVAPSLDAELALLGRAAAELDAGRVGTARSLLAQHAAKYPKSMLTVERETLRILVECRLHPGPQSETQAKRFLQQHPKLLHRSRLERSCLRSPLAPPEPNLAPRETAKATPAAPGERLRGRGDSPSQRTAQQSSAGPAPSSASANEAPKTPGPDSSHPDTQPPPTAAFPALKED